MKKTNYSYIGISLIILVFGIWAVPKIVEKFSAPELAVIENEQNVPALVPPFTFTNQNGETITNDDFKGKVYIVEFFFTTCTDICPIMTQNMVKVQDAFFGNPNVAIASISIDPAHDTPEVLKEYAKNHKITKPQWHLLTGEKEDVLKLSNEGFKIYAAEIEEDGIFEHSGFFALVDQNGNIRSRTDENGNPIIYYDGLDDKAIKMLIEDIQKLL